MKMLPRQILLPEGFETDALLCHRASAVLLGLSYLRDYRRAHGIHPL